MKRLPAASTATPLVSFYLTEVAETPYTLSRGLLEYDNAPATVVTPDDALGRSVGVGVMVPAVGDTPLGVDAGTEDIDALGVVVPAVGDTPLGVDA